ncbi:MAG: rhodanese-like domain-containing protein [Bdellovibrionaceae bacterium]|nr:rhodanese-like domain-containing protein [Pseudobdellovibrionaceae bacterium]MBX3032713.1 rhodanese-like domain-containing protein [Pseudobdellovibrionaceae bacterium]
MPSILHEIGFFQFENLVRNRVSFLLLNLGADTKGLFQGFYQNHLEAQTLASTPATAVQDVRARGVPADQAILILCDSGRESGALVDALENAGYTNVYYVSGGVSALRAELGK